MAGRPKSEDPAKTYTVRLSGSLLAKFVEVARYQRRKPTELLRLLVEDEVAQHEVKHGNIAIAPPQP